MAHPYQGVAEDGSDTSDDEDYVPEHGKSEGKFILQQRNHDGFRVEFS